MSRPVQCSLSLHKERKSSKKVRFSESLFFFVEKHQGEGPLKKAMRLQEREKKLKEASHSDNHRSGGLEEVAQSLGFLSYEHCVKATVDSLLGDPGVRKRSIQKHKMERAVRAHLISRAKKLQESKMWDWVMDSYKDNPTEEEEKRRKDAPPSASKPSFTQTSSITPLDELVALFNGG